MLIELPSKEVKELFEGDFTQTSGRQRKDNHLTPPPPHFPRASLHRCTTAARSAHTHARTYTHTHACTSAAAAPQPRGAPGSPAPYRAPSTGGARPPPCPARLSARGHGGKRPAAARLPPAIPSGRGSALPRSPLHPTFPSACRRLT